MENFTCRSAENFNIITNRKNIGFITIVTKIQAIRLC